MREVKEVHTQHQVIYPEKTAVAPSIKCAPAQGAEHAPTRTYLESRRGGIAAVDEDAHTLVTIQHLRRERVGAEHGHAGASQHRSSRARTPLRARRPARCRRRGLLLCRCGDRRAGGARPCGPVRQRQQRWRRGERRGITRQVRRERGGERGGGQQLVACEEKVGRPAPSRS